MGGKWGAERRGGDFVGGWHSRSTEMKVGEAPCPVSRPAESISAIGERSSQTVYAGEGV
jgi:hypothetical protein